MRKFPTSSGQTRYEGLLHSRALCGCATQARLAHHLELPATCNGFQKEGIAYRFARKEMMQVSVWPTEYEERKAARIAKMKYGPMHGLDFNGNPLPMNKPEEEDNPTAEELPEPPPVRPSKRGDDKQADQVAHGGESASPIAEAAEPEAEAGEAALD